MGPLQETKTLLTIKSILQSPKLSLLNLIENKLNNKEILETKPEDWLVYGLFQYHLSVRALISSIWAKAYTTANLPFSSTSRFLDRKWEKPSIHKVVFVVQINFKSR